ncbi:MAG TPA: FAD-dependent oxidoreductase [Candidatus Paceibacterota bacterium]|nr:FAD-dependent oxidoreductase [Candidatus Paceibacterota bacterium]
MIYDLIIIGGGPGGVAAGIYAARKKMKSVLITDSFGGQSLNSAGIENWIGTKAISGFDLAKNLEEHLRSQAGIEIVAPDMVTKIEKKDVGIPNGGFLVTTQSGKTFETKYVLVTAGSRRKRLGVPGEDAFDGKGVVFCTTCDAPLFEGKTVAVVGGGNSALESVLDLIPYASKIYLIVRSNVLKGDPVSQEKVKTHPQVTIMWNTVIEEIRGDKFVTGVRYKDTQTGESKELALDGVFVEVGLTPNSDFTKGLLETEQYGHIHVDHQTQATSQPGIWAAGDVTDGLYQQNNISVGDSIKAVLNIYDKIKTG